MKIKKKIVLFIALISLFYLVTTIENTYAKYISSATAEADMTIARWNILVNNQDILNNSNFSNTISPVFAGTQYINSGVLAPTSTGYFDIIINGTNTDITFQYTLTMNLSSANTITDLKITSYTIDGVSHNFDGSPISEQIVFNSGNKTRTIRVNVEWIDGISTETMNNSQDTQAANGGTAAIDVNINFIQVRQ